jgi:hypothetical protein
VNKSTLVGLSFVGVCLLSTASSSADPRVHDGFQFRGAVGPGFLSTSASQGSQSLTIGGVAGNGELYFGGTPVRGLVIGGMIQSIIAFSPSISLNGQSLPNGSSSSSLSFLSIAPYVNYYLDPAGGFYFLGHFGYGAESYTQNGASGSSPSGIAIGAGAGYDFWVSDQWSLGILGKFTYAPLSLNGVSYSTIAPAVLFSFNYH